MLPALIRRALAKETPFRVWGSPDVVRDFVFVDDVVQAALDVLQRHVVCNPVNVGLGRGITIGATVRLILELCDHPAAVEYDQSRPTAIPYRVLDTSQWESLAGGASKTSLRDGLQKTIAWYRAHEHTAQASGDAPRLKHDLLAHVVASVANRKFG